MLTSRRGEETVPIYSFKCKQCGEILEYAIPFKDLSSASIEKCQHCGGTLARIYEPPYVNMGKRSRVFHQWHGSPDSCPEGLKETLKSQDMTKGTSIFAKDGRPKLGTGDKFNRGQE